MSNVSNQLTICMSQSTNHTYASDELVREAGWWLLAFLNTVGEKFLIKQEKGRFIIKSERGCPCGCSSSSDCHGCDSLLGVLSKTLEILDQRLTLSHNNCTNRDDPCCEFELFLVNNA